MLLRGTIQLPICCEHRAKLRGKSTALEATRLRPLHFRRHHVRPAGAGWIGKTLSVKRTKSATKRTSSKSMPSALSRAVHSSYRDIADVRAHGTRADGTSINTENRISLA